MNILAYHSPLPVTNAELNKKGKKIAKGVKNIGCLVYRRY